MNLKDRKWKKFSLSDLFNMKRGTRLTEDNRIIGKTPLATAGHDNQGVSAFIGNADQERFSPSLTIDMFGESFYRGYDFCCDDNIHVLEPKDAKLDKHSHLFLATIVNSSKHVFGYGKQYRSKTFRKQVVVLPIDNNNDPDWQFMSDYMRRHEKKMISQYEKYLATLKLSAKQTFNERKWREMMSLHDRKSGEFKIGNIFTVSGTITTHPTVLISGGQTPRITCAATNNGFENTYYNTPTEEGGVLTIDSATVGYVSYQPVDFIATDHVEKLSMKDGKRINRFIGLFLTRAIASATNEKYGYGYKFSQTRIKRQTILLPVDNADEPDWQFMENYMKVLEGRQLSRYIAYLRYRNITSSPNVVE